MRNAALSERKGIFSRFQLELTEKFTIFAVITNKIQTMEIPTPSIADLAELTGSPHLDGDLLLFDKLTDFPLPVGAGRTSNIVVALCLEGNSTYMANTVEHRVGPDDVLIIHDGQVVDGYRIDPAQRSIGLIMSPDFFHEVLKDIHELASLIIFSRSHPVFRLTPHETENMIEYYRLVKAKVADGENGLRRDVVRHLISAMVCELCNAIRRLPDCLGERQMRAEKIFADFIRLVEQNYKMERRVGWYGEQMCITPKYLSETVKTVSRRTPNEWIDNYVTMELRAQLHNTTKSIKEIAREMNFPNQSFLGKYFKEHVGMSPMSYRKS